MKTDSKKEKGKDFIFSDEVDGAIGGAAVGVAFVVAAIFVTFNKYYLNNEIATTIIRWLFLLFGTPISLASALSKAKCDSNRLAWGFFLGGVWLLLYSYVDWLWVRIIGILLLFIAVFLILQELFFLICSIMKKSPKASEDNSDRTKNLDRTNSLFAFITTILGLILVAIQMLQQFGVI